MEKIVKTLPLITAFLIFNGFLKLYIYYNHWDIRIVDYLSFSEIILSFLNDIYVIVLYLLVVLIYLIFGVTYIEQAPNSQKIIGDTIRRYPVIILIGAFIIACIFLELFLCYDNIGWLYFTIIYMWQFFIALFNLSILRKKEFTFAAASIMTFLIFTVCLAIHDIKQVEKNAPNTITTIYKDNEILMTSPTNLFLGKSQNFIYLYNTQMHCSQIIPVSRIKSIETQTRYNRE